MLQRSFRMKGSSLRNRLTWICLGLLQSTGGTAANPRPEPKLLSEATACRAIPDNTQRLACFDRTVAALQNAYSQADLLVVDKETVRKNKRSLFGLSLPSFDLFGSDNPDKEDTEITTTLRSAQFDANGLLLFVVSDGANWVQTDDNTIPSLPKVGASVTLKSGALGSYFATIGHTSFRARRLK